VARGVSEIQNASLGEYRIRELNDQINKLLREKVPVLHPANQHSPPPPHVVALLTNLPLPPVPTFLTLWVAKNSLADGGVEGHGYLFLPFSSLTYLKSIAGISSLKKDFLLDILVQFLGFSFWVIIIIVIYEIYGFCV